MATYSTDARGQTSLYPVNAGDRLVVAGHLGLTLTASGVLSWHSARLDLASHRMVFPESGVLLGAYVGPHQLAESLLQAAILHYDVVTLDRP